ncbi:MAG: DUF2330 domain-containing protein [Deltaproteobacteria bacterium]|nr:DUF2330 domain-containing protein [Deltaproteobacteria bacterium]
MDRSKALAAALVSACTASLLAPAALACGAMFSSTTSESEIIDMSDQRALLVSHDGRVDQFVQIAYEGNPSEFAWVYPFPAQPTLEQVRSDLFEQLDEGTRPRFWITSPSSEDPGCDCLPMMGAGASARGGAGDGIDAGLPVQVWGNGEVGVFDYVIITAVSVDDMLAWLDDNGFRAPAGADAVLKHYVDLGWFFVAMRLSPGTSADEVTATIRFSYLSDALTYPLYMSSISAASDLGVLLYVLAPHRMDAAGGYATLEIRDRVGVVDETTTNYESQFDGAIAEAGGRAFVVEYANSGTEVRDMLWGVEGIPDGAGELFLTRLRTVVSAGAYADVPLARAATDEPVSSTFDLMYPGVVNAAVGGWALLAGLFSYTLLRGAARRLAVRRSDRDRAGPVA